MSVDVLYIHPWGHLNDLVVPAGALACMNALAAPKLGRYAFEVTDDEIRAARVVAVDLHWALALTGFVHLVAHVRAVNPTVPIVVGGITAGLWAHELLRRFPVDYVLRGDSERSFAILVERLLAGGDPAGIPNVFGRGVTRPQLVRMTQAEFDAADTLTADWFPTYDACSGWDAAAFPAGRTLVVSRGCAFGCPECYGSFGPSFGRGYLLRSAECVVRDLCRAADLGLRNLRLFVGKPPGSYLSALLRALAAAGPFRFSSAVGIYLCQAPTAEDLEALDAAFDTPVTLSLIPPGEHIPAVPSARLEREEEAWRAVANRVARSRTLSLDVWVARSSEPMCVRRAFTDVAIPRVKVSSAAAWTMIRPTSAQASATFDEVRAAVEPVWTFYAARVLCPALARLLEPFRYLDELDSDQEHVPVPAGALGALHAQVMESWRRYTLPTLPGLRFCAAAVRRRPGSARGGAGRFGVRLTGSLRVFPITALTPDPPVLLATRADHRGVVLAEALPVPRGCDAVALAPAPPPAATTPLDRAWMEGVAGDGLVVAEFPATGANRLLRLEIHVRVQEADVAVLDADNEIVARGRATLGYFTAHHRRPSGVGRTRAEPSPRLVQLRGGGAPRPPSRPGTC